MERQTPVLQRKRKRNANVGFTPRRTGSFRANGGKEALKTDKKQQWENHQGKDNARDKDWTRALGNLDATESETSGLVRAVYGAARSVFVKTFAKITGHGGNEPIVADNNASEGHSDQSSTTTCSDTVPKRRRVDADADDFVTPVKPSKSSLRKDLENMPQINESNVDYKFATQSPIAEWAKVPSTTQQHNSQSLQQQAHFNNYGTSFIRSKKKLRSTDHKLVSHLQSMYKGEFKETPLKSSSPSPAFQTSNDQTMAQNMSSLSKFIQRFFKDKADNYPKKRTDDDVIFLREVKLPPPPTRSNLSLTFDTQGLTFADDFSYYHKLLQERREQSERIHKEVLEASRPKSTLINQLTQDEEKEVTSIWKSKGRDHQVLNQISGIDLKVHDLKSLADGHWLNDNVIDAFLSTLSNERVHVFSTFFFTNLESRGYSSVKKWMKKAKKDISKLEMIICPININQTHWVTGAIDLKNKKLLYMDSLAGLETPHGSRSLCSLSEYLTGEAEKQGQAQVSQGFEMVQVTTCPQQSNGYDCGVFTLMNSLHLAKGSPLEYDPKLARAFRRVAAYRILHHA